jgi:hypothetical protein
MKPRANDRAGVFFVRSFELSSTTKRASTINLIKQTVSTIMSVLREIFDESAYQRYLCNARLMPSRNAYASFRKELESSKMKQHRCC